MNSIVFLLNWDLFHARQKPLQGMELQEKEAQKIKAYMQRIPESSCAKKENAIYQNNE